MLFSKRLGFDLGTSYMHICQKDKGVILYEPEIIAIDKQSKSPVAVGKDAYDMLERAPHTISIYMPVKHGVVADFDSMLNLLNIQCQNLKNYSKKASVVVTVPYNISEVEQRALYDIFASSKNKFKKIYMIQKPVAAGIGCDIDVLAPEGNLIVDIGGGTTEVSVVSLGGVVISSLIKVGGEKFDCNIRNYVKKKYNLLIGLKTAEKIKKTIGNTLEEVDDEKGIRVTGRDVVTGLPNDIYVTSIDVYHAIKEDVNLIVETIKSILEKTPPELSADILSKGIYITGGTANIKNIEKLIAKETGIVVNPVETPESSVIRGVLRILNDYSKHKNILYTFE